MPKNEVKKCMFEKKMTTCFLIFSWSMIKNCGWIFRDKHNPGNVLVWVQRVQEPAGLWDISFCTRRILTNFITFLKSLIKVEVATDFSVECDRRKDNCGERNFV